MSRAKHKKIAHEKRMKAQKQEKDNSYKVGWRTEGTPDDNRYGSVAEAERARRRVNRMKPVNPRGKKQTGGRRPNAITAERVHHSRGKKWDEFLIAMGYDNLTESQQLSLFDSFKNGGSETFAKWKQREYESWTVVKKLRILDYGNRKMQVVQMEDGTFEQIPFIDPEAEAVTSVKRSRSRKPKHCVECGMSIPIRAQAVSDKCERCAPAVTAASFFKSILKQQAAKK